jgi:HNH endonuclease
MPEGRPPIPRELRRAVLVEVGHRCAIPACRQYPVEVEHIDDWAKVKEHRFENLIALCPTCHARKGDGPGQIDRKSLRQYKANLAVLNSRYGDVEQRLIEYCAEQLARGREGRPFGGLPLVTLGLGSEWQVMYLLRDGYLEKYPVPLRPSLSGIPLMEQYILTEAGAEFVQRWMQARPLEPSEASDQRQQSAQ